MAASPASSAVPGVASAAPDGLSRPLGSCTEVGKENSNPNQSGKRVRVASEARGASAPSTRKGTDRPNPTTELFRKYTEDAERNAKAKSEVYMAYAALVDGLVASYSEKGHQGLQLKQAEILRAEVNNHLATLFLGRVAINPPSEVPTTPPASPPIPAMPPTATAGQSALAGVSPRPSTPARVEKELAWTEVTKRGHNSKPGTPNVGRAVTKTAPQPQQLQQDDLRVFFRVPSMTKQSQNAYSLRQALLRELPEISNGLKEVKEINTGWAACMNSLAARDLLLTPGNLEKAYGIFGTHEYSLPVKWYNYALPWTPSAVTALDGTPLNVTKEMVAEEATFYTKKTPVDCRHGKKGVDPKTGLTTWVVSFLEEVPRFKLFNMSGWSQLCDKKPRIDLHDPGCQEYCNPRLCRREARCKNCSRPIHEHKETGPCRAHAKCVNFSGPFPADHEKCPAAPTRNAKGHMNQLPRRVRTKVRAEGERAWAVAHPEEAAAAKRASGPSITAHTTEITTEMDTEAAPAPMTEPSTSPAAALDLTLETGLSNPPSAPTPAPMEESSSNKRRHRDLRDYLEKVESTSKAPARAPDPSMCPPTGSTQDAVAEQVYAELMDCVNDSIMVSEDLLQAANQTSTSPEEEL